MPTINRDDTKRWILPTLIGFTLTLAIWGTYRTINPAIDQNIVTAAKTLDINPRIYNDIMQMRTTIENAGDLSNRDWNRLHTYLQDPNIQLRRDALSACMLMKRSKHRTEILQIAQTHLNSGNAILEGPAVCLLWRFHDPNWRTEALKRRNDPDESVRDFAQTALDRGDNTP